MNRQTLRRLERTTRAKYYHPDVLRTLHQRARRARNDEDPATIHYRLFVALQTPDELTQPITVDELPELFRLDELQPLPTLGELTNTTAGMFDDAE